MLCSVNLNESGVVSVGASGPVISDSWSGLAIISSLLKNIFLINLFDNICFVIDNFLFYVKGGSFYVKGASSNRNMNLLL